MFCIEIKGNLIIEQNTFVMWSIKRERERLTRGLHILQNFMKGEEMSIYHVINDDNGGNVLNGQTIKKTLSSGRKLSRTIILTTYAVI